ncbi:MAG: hypothetical protein IPK16_22770 [Anaerolineales bacterium]|nr:hypothetical protein [Anaerolineales bacterium]
MSERINRGIVLVPEDRQREGRLVQTISVAHNMLLASLRNYFQRTVPDPAKEQTAAVEMVKGFHQGGESNADHPSLSGGNTAKSGRRQGAAHVTQDSAARRAESRGIDVAAKSEILPSWKRLASKVLACSLSPRS